MIRQVIINYLDKLYPYIPIYGEEVLQRFEEPSFYVKVLNTNHKKEFNTRYNRTYNIDIHYFGKSNKDCESMAEELYENMEYLQGNYTKGINMNHKVTEGVLHFLIDYKLRLNRDIVSYPKFSDMEVNQYGK